MQMKFFRIPVMGGSDEETFNRFLRNERVLNVHREFVVATLGQLLPG